MRPLYVAVYGSLKRGFHNHHFLQGSVFMGQFETGPGFALLDLGDYPGMIRRGRGRVVVEVYRVSPSTLIHLDRLESAPRVYRRVRVPVAGFGWAQGYMLTPRFVRSLAVDAASEYTIYPGVRPNPVTAVADGATGNNVETTSPLRRW